jgi:hypothetical protein
MLVALDAAALEHVETAREWDFSGREHSQPPSADLGGEPEPVALYPALYPVGERGLAVALISHSNEAYSGGGATFDYADFVTLEGTPVFETVPFACSKMIRACFREEEYAKSSHCHDEWTGYLSIRYGAAGIQSFVWHETEWPAHQTTTQGDVTPFRMTATGPEPPIPGGVSFCGGTVDDQEELNPP